ncbi:carbohydrate-responsive element-binding protein isoform X2 [Takifugu rubripes]|uniref:Carbohydrate-responsive element-binding protein n=1 Tax=Takifugu rubripes TaxID=31033 RepID=A0A674NZ27_TAKRU|nr:carbohydrate-responsive element-binding protein isoform X2 [Takifugu rubripes]|eukprot:XP_011616316.1 PREDICTED: carbohydrate-responsive element-binding protein isoform X2 [Takifugu rubripes]
MACKGKSCSARRNHLQDFSDSDSEADGEAARVAGTGASSGSLPRSQVIHSGHFMVSSPHNDLALRRRRSGGFLKYDFDTVNRTWCQTYRYGPLSSGSLSIDPTLTRLFDCMSLAYSGKIVSPKWKSFKGLRLLWRDKIRLNNAIWRAWFIQYLEKRKNPVCGFVTPLEGSEADSHGKPEAIVMEGSYWKRRIEVVIKEYHKWRIYYKKRLQKKKDDILSILHQGQICQAKLEKWTNQMYPEPEATPVEAHMFDLDCLLSDISDTLFTMTQKPCPWASDRHEVYTSNADMIQPGLMPLQPNLDDFMDIPDIFMGHRGQPSEQSTFADCGYFENSTGTEFTPAPSPVVTAPPLLFNTQLAQPSSNSQPVQTRSDQACGEYQTLGSLLFEHQSYPDPADSVVYASSIDQPTSSAVTFMHPLPCHKYSYCTAISVTPTVITHTASTVGVQGFGYQATGLHQTEGTYHQTPGFSLGFPSDPLTMLPPVTVTDCFPVLEPMAVTEVRGKHKQKSGGVRRAGPSGGQSGPSASYAPTPTLAKLLSSGSREQKPLIGFDQTGKGRRSSTPSSSSSCSAHVDAALPLRHHGANWPAGMPLMMPQNNPQPSLTLPSNDSAVSALLTHSLAHNSATLLVPKTEKLSPVQLHATDGNSLTVRFPEHPGQTSPPNLTDKMPTPESTPASFSGHAKMETDKQTETRRITHISAEQKRRFNIKLGFDTLHNLVAMLSSQPSIKVSKATTLQKTAEYINKMQQERTQLHEETQRLKEEIQLLNSAINVSQLQLPATGVPITQQRFDHMRQMFKEYVRAQTLQNWKFWIFSIIIEPLFESYNGMVSTASMEELCRSTLSWLDQHCSLPALRPMVLRSLRLLSTTTAILTDPSLLPEQATLAVTQSDHSALLEHSLHPPTRDSIHPCDC